MYHRGAALVAWTTLLCAALLPWTGCRNRPDATGSALADVTPLPPPPLDAAPASAEATPPEADTASPPPETSAGLAADAAQPLASDAGATEVPPAAEAAPLTGEEARLVATAVNAFAADLYPKLAAGQTNMAFSPASVVLALAMTSAGARGETAAEMNSVLRLGDDPDRTRDLLGREQRLLAATASEAVKLVIANRLFGERSYGFQQAFLDWTAAQFGAPFEPVDFRGAPEPSRARINDWVKQQTQDRIPVILPPASIDTDTRLVLANAIWFKGQWSNPFDEGDTRPRPFTLADGSRVDVPMMSRTDDFRFGVRGGTKLLELPYAGDDLSMVVVLPPEGQAPDAWLTADNLATVASLRRQEVDVWLPRFRIDPPEPTKLNQMLIDLGMRRAFVREQAEFPGIADPPNPEDRLFLSAVFHRAFVEVNEEGTEAAAATAALLVRVGAAAPDSGPAVFHADRPFLFLIRERRTGLILFVGRVGDPRAAG